LQLIEDDENFIEPAGRNTASDDLLVHVTHHKALRAEGIR